jgi:hypothetical protein
LRTDKDKFPGNPLVGTVPAWVERGEGAVVPVFFVQERSMAGEEAPAAAAGPKKDEKEKPAGAGGGEGEEEEEEEEHQSIGKNLVNPDIIFDRWAGISTTSWPWSFRHISTHTNVMKYVFEHATHTHCISLH